MKPAIISNTGPILALSGAGHLDLIMQLYTRVIVPESVDIEIRHTAGKTGLDCPTIYKPIGFK